MSSERTIEEWLSELPDPYATLAIQNAVKRGSLATKASSVADAVDAMACWEDTPEGGRFWDSIYGLHLSAYEASITSYPPVRKDDPIQ